MNPQNPVISTNSNCFNVTSIYDNRNIFVSDVKPEVLEWLSPLASREMHQAVRDARVDGVGDWLLRTEMFSTWRMSEYQATKPVILCYGDPWSGKTYMSSLVIDTLSDGIGGDCEVVTYVYCNFSARDTQSATTVLASVLRQVVGVLAEIPAEVRNAFECAKRQVDGCGPRLSEILNMLTKSLPNLKRSFICIDALDELPQQDRPELWEHLQRIVRECPSVRLFLTGRSHIRGEVQKYFPETEMLRITPNEHDLGLYLKMRLSRDLEPDAMDNGLQADILRLIPERISGIFLLARTSMDSILAEVTVHKRRQALDRITNGPGLRDACSRTLDRIKQQGEGRAKLGIKALMWASCCERPLRSDELCHALGVELGAGDFDVSNIPKIWQVLGCALGLLTIDKRASTIRLLHPALREYFGESLTPFATAHSIMAEICLTYLNCPSIRAPPPNPDTALATPLFLEYAACFWGDHAARAVTGRIIALALRVLDGYENHISAAIFQQKKICRLYPGEGVEGISGLHCIAFWGIAEIATAMLKTERWNVNRRDSSGDTALMWAVKHGKDRVAEILLARPEIEPGEVVTGGYMVSSLAAPWENDGVVRLLLAHRGTDPNLPDNSGRTPLSFAAQSGGEGVVRLLLERGDVNPNSPDSNGLVPLSYAAGREGIVRLFLERGDVNINLVDSNGHTAGGPPLDTSNSHSTVSEPTQGQEQALPRQQPLPNQSDPDSAPSTPLLILGSGLPFQFILLVIGILIGYFARSLELNSD